jgi:hypothetical protein
MNGLEDILFQWTDSAGRTHRGRRVLAFDPDGLLGYVTYQTSPASNGNFVLLKTSYDGVYRWSPSKHLRQVEFRDD